ncbi:MAG: tetraacyldisaccharide 4'-kinase [Gammaproteobacteria bacterium]|nr:tetraacyldisaccharide 4'-kinase [Gammaproteobacteria bacterium]
MNLHSIWYSNHPVSLLLTPASWLFCFAAKTRKFAYQHGLRTTYRASVPVIVAGNICVGGSGKTPLVMWLVQFLKEHGFKPGIVSRGYRGKASQWPREVFPSSDPRMTGDESVLLACRTGVPTTVAPKRRQAIELLLKKHDCDIIISDDGLQHYAMNRDIEIAVVDDMHRHGNQRCLPAGPLREPVSRLDDVDFVVSKGASYNNEFSMQYHAKPLCTLLDDRVTQPLHHLRGQKVHAIAGIGNPERFFNRLQELGIKATRHVFPDHYFYNADDIYFDAKTPVIMTEKDAVKCREFAGPQHWYLPIDAHLPAEFGRDLLNLLKQRAPYGQKIT